MFSINLKALLTRGSDEGFLTPGAQPAAGGQARASAGSHAELSLADRPPTRQVPTPIQGFGASGGLGMW